MNKIGEELVIRYPSLFKDDGYHGIVCTFGHREYRQKLTNNLIDLVEVINYGNYSMVQVKKDSDIIKPIELSQEEITKVLQEY